MTSRKASNHVKVITIHEGDHIPLCDRILLASQVEDSKSKVLDEVITTAEANAECEDAHHDVQHDELDDGESNIWQEVSRQGSSRCS